MSNISFEKAPLAHKDIPKRNSQKHWVGFLGEVVQIMQVSKFILKASQAQLILGHPQC